MKWKEGVEWEGDHQGWAGTSAPLWKEGLEWEGDHQRWAGRPRMGGRSPGVGWYFRYFSTCEMEGRPRMGG